MADKMEGAAKLPFFPYRPWLYELEVHQSLRFNDANYSLVILRALDEVVQHVGFGTNAVVVLPDEASRPELGRFGVMLGQFYYLLSMQAKTELENVGVETEKRHLLVHIVV